MIPKFILWYIDPGTGFTIFSVGGWLIAFFVGILGMFGFFFKGIFRFFKKFKKIFFLILGLVIAGLIIKGVFMKPPTSTFDKKVIILGFDGLSPEIIEPMMAEGKLPNFAKLKERGSYRRLSTTNPSQSPVAWTGFATGKNPGKNGLFDFITRDPKTYKLDLSLSKMERGRPKNPIKAKCFWNYTSQKNIPTVVLTCPVTYPADKLYGRMISGMGTPDILGTEGTFTFYTSEELDQAKDIGGKVFHVRKSDLMVMNLLGPKVAVPGGKADNVKVPFKAAIVKDALVIEFQNQKTELKAGQWSDWQSVSFSIGPFTKAKGIFKFYLVSLEPELKLYISPINFDPRSPLFQISYPPAYSKELADALGLYYTQGMPMDTWAVNEGRLDEKPFLQIVDAVFRQTKARLDFELARFEKGVLFCYFETSDIIQHMFWRFLDPEHPLYEDNQQYKQIIYKHYQALDEVLGEVLQRLQPQDTLIVLSDHGFNTFRRAAHINSWLKANGYLEFSNPYADMGRELLIDVDWSRTKAYAIGFGGIYINQKGREEKGIVSPGEETDSLKKQIAQKLEKWMDDKYGQQVVHKVYLNEEIFEGPYASEAPDLYLGFNIGYRASWQTAMGAAPEGLMEDNLKKWSGDHLFDPALIPGIIFSNQKIVKDNPSILDVTPTILKVVGFDADTLRKEDFDGSPLF